MSFKVDDSFDSGKYVMVHIRLKSFRIKYPEGDIITEVVREGEKIVGFKAMLFRKPESIRPFATGHGFAGELDTKSEKVLEFVETVAVGRALGMSGEEIEKALASQEEMVKFKTTKSKFKVAKTEEEKSIEAAEAEAECNNTKFEKEIEEKKEEEPKLKGGTNFKKSRFSSNK